MSINADALYKVVLKGRVNNQDVVNVLWYKVGVDLLPGALNFGGADLLANLVHSQVWTGTLRSTMNTLYLLSSIQVYPYDENFSPILQLPYERNVGEYGQSAGAINGSAPCLIAKFNLEPTSILQGFFPPKRGYVALGPIRDDYIDNTGNVEGDFYNYWQLAANRFTIDLVSVVPPMTFEPVRVSTRTILGVFTFRGWAGIQSVSLRHRASFRRSRLPEAN